MIKTFRGKLKDQEQQKIRLSTKKGKIGYRIVKFEIIGVGPGTNNVESVVKIFKITQTSVTDDIDFSDGNLLGVGFWQFNSSNPAYSTPYQIIFDTEIFNQDIYITNRDASANANSSNYYLELETISLTDNAAAVSTLRDIRLNPQVGA